MPNNTIIASYVCVSLGFLCYLLAVIYFPIFYNPNTAKKNHSRWFIYFSVLFIAIATFLSASGKSSLAKEDKIDIVIVILSLLATVAIRNCGLIGLSLLTFISVISASQLIFVA